MRIWRLLGLCMLLIAECSASLAAERPVQQRIVRDVVYTHTPSGRLLLNIYYPPQLQGAVPVVLYIHGGDWMYGNRGDAAGAFLTEYGMAVASIDYRLAPRSRFPAQAKDCRDALIFLHENAKKYALDPDRIGVMGESAGGHLAALTATAPETPEFIGSYHDKSAPRVKAFCSVSGPMDIAYLGALGDMVEDLVGKHDIYQLIGGRVQDKLELANLASPVQHVSSDDPPALLIYGEKDFLVLPIVAQKMHERLQAAGVPSELYPISEMGHDMAAIYSSRTREVIAGFFQRHLLGYPTTRPISK